MEYKNRLTTTVKAFWDGDGRSIDDAEGRIEAITRATRDLMARTLKRIAPEAESFNHAVIGALLPKIDEWFSIQRDSITQETFDDWHREACKEILSVLRTFYINQDGTPVAYGKAQKIINMTMKGIYCLDGAQKMDMHFQYCHMALDSFILEWFCRKVMPWYNNGKKTKERLKKTAMVSWSVIPEGTGEAPYGYNTYVQHIRDYFVAEHPYDGLNPLQAEFFIWSEIQLELAAESLYGQDIGKFQAIEKARSTWKTQWIAENVDSKDINGQFDWCKRMFKKQSLEYKMNSLQRRVKELCDSIKQPDSSPLGCLEI